MNSLRCILSYLVKHLFDCFFYAIIRDISLIRLLALWWERWGKPTAIRRLQVDLPTYYDNIYDIDMTLWHFWASICTILNICFYTRLLILSTLRFRKWRTRLSSQGRTTKRNQTYGRPLKTLKQFWRKCVRVLQGRQPMTSILRLKSWKNWKTML